MTSPIEDLKGLEDIRKALKDLLEQTIRSEGGAKTIAERAQARGDIRGILTSLGKTLQVMSSLIIEAVDEFIQLLKGSLSADNSRAKIALEEVTLELKNCVDSNSLSSGIIKDKKAGLRDKVKEIFEKPQNEILDVFTNELLGSFKDIDLSLLKEEEALQISAEMGSDIKNVSRANIAKKLGEAADIMDSLINNAKKMALEELSKRIDYTQGPDTAKRILELQMLVCFVEALEEALAPDKLREKAGVLVGRLHIKSGKERIVQAVPPRMRRGTRRIERKSIKRVKARINRFRGD